MEEEAAEAGLNVSQAFFWMCNFCIRQSGGKDDDVPRLGQMVQECGRTVMFLEPWDKMVAASPGENVNCLSRAWCVFEVRGWGVKTITTATLMTPPPFLPSLFSSCSATHPTS